jgi:tRNA(Ile)-lysidine synthase
MPAIEVPDLPQRVAAYIHESRMPLPGERILVALSGGADSIALTCILLELGYCVEAAHCNFGLRVEAVDEEDFVKEFAAGLGVPIHTRRFGEADFLAGKGEGIQQTARKLRYAFFEELMATLGIAHCATGHHADDETETLILSFFRSKGPIFLQGIPPLRGPYFRPLLCLTKQEIMEWLRQKGQAWCHDRSNDASDYRRNLVRNQLLPTLEELHPGFKEHFHAQARRHHAQWAVLDTVFKAIAPAVVQAEREGFWISFHAYGKAFEERHLPVFLDWWLHGQGFTGTETLEIQRLVEAQVGAIHETRSGWKVLRDRDGLRFSKEPERDSPSGILFTEGELVQGCSVEYAGEGLYLKIRPRPDTLHGREGMEVHWMDASLLQRPLRLRAWREGDRMRPLGMEGTQKISDILINQKRSRFAKKHAWVLEDGEGIVLLGGYRIAQRVAIHHATTDCLYIEVSNLQAEAEAAEWKRI